MQMNSSCQFVERGNVLMHVPCLDLKQVNEERKQLGRKPIKLKELRRKIAVLIHKQYNHIQWVVKDRTEIDNIVRDYYKVLGKGVYVFVNQTGHVLDYIICLKNEQKWFKNRQRMLDKSVLLGFRSYNAPKSVKSKMALYRKRKDIWNEYINK